MSQKIQNCTVFSFIHLSLNHQKLFLCLGMIEWLACLLYSHCVLSLTSTDAISCDARTYQREINIIEINLVLALQNLGSYKAPQINKLQPTEETSF